MPNSPSRAPARPPRSVTGPRGTPGRASRSRRCSPRPPFRATATAPTRALLGALEVRRMACASRTCQGGVLRRCRGRGGVGGFAELAGASEQRSERAWKLPPSLATRGPVHLASSKPEVSRSRGHPGGPMPPRRRPSGSTALIELVCHCLPRFCAPGANGPVSGRFPGLRASARGGCVQRWATSSGLTHVRSGSPASAGSQCFLVDVAPGSVPGCSSRLALIHFIEEEEIWLGCGRVDRLRLIGRGPADPPRPARPPASASRDALVFLRATGSSHGAGLERDTRPAGPFLELATSLPRLPARALALGPSRTPPACLGASARHGGCAG